MSSIPPPSKISDFSLQASKVVELEIDGILERIGTTEQLELATPSAEDLLSPLQLGNPNVPFSRATPVPVSKGKQKTKRSKNGKYQPTPQGHLQDTTTGTAGSGSSSATPSPSTAPPFPVINFEVLEDYDQGIEFEQPKDYLRATKPEEGRVEVVYDLDEQDIEWLNIINTERAKKGTEAPVMRDNLEFIMDQLEKEAYFQMQSVRLANCQEVDDDDAVCSVCSNGECNNTNAIIFCDLCNLAVHQDCYGVPYVPEGQWLCRKCLYSPSQSLSCALCPNKDGALKMTEDGRWAHVVCALWIPHVGFANSVFLEPIENIDRVPAGKWKLYCFICKEKGTGVCIQCDNPTCNKRFHVTCAQEAHLLMTVESGPGVSTVVAKKFVYCNIEHMPSKNPTSKKDDGMSKVLIKRAREVIAIKRGAVPSASAPIPVPIIPEERVAAIVSAIEFPGKAAFMEQVKRYWSLKRYFRNGAPLIHGLQLPTPAASASAPIPKTNKALPAPPVGKLEYSTRRLRQELERARLLCELLRKRERQKRDLILARLKLTALEICPMSEFFHSILRELKSHDQREIFACPVDVEEVSDYLSIVKEPMDLGTISAKVDRMEYLTLEDVENDFKLMIANCLLFNKPSTIYYKAAVRLRAFGEIVFEKAKPLFDSAGYDPVSGLHFMDDIA